MAGTGGGDGAGYSESYWLRMAELAFFGSTSPSEYHDMLPEESAALWGQVSKLRDDERAIRLEYVKGIIKSNGARLL